MKPYLLPAPESHPFLPITKAQPAALDLIDMVLSQMTTATTRRMYKLRLVDFIRYRDTVERGIEALSREGVGKYLLWLETQGNSISARNQTLAAIKLLAKEAELRGLIDGDTFRGIKLISTLKQPGVRLGNWLTAEELTTFYMLPDRSTLPGLRDAVIMALLCACGLRRAEACSITWDRYQEREGRMVLVDLTGKGNRIRSVVVPEWAEKDLNNWHEEMSRYGMGGGDQCILAGMPIRPGVAWRRKPTTTEPTGFRESLGEGRVWQIVKKYAVMLELSKRAAQTSEGIECSKHFVPKLSPHDLRRTLARLMHDAEANIIEIQLTLGHANLQTTQKYLGAMQLKLRRGTAAVDKIQLNFEREKKAE